ncbi:hypothetical protein ACNF5F_27350, partial [Escherichia coli]|uniref:hypothetical protein n=1 Tax=Escherichia coli TaxID=562 RepID=UPI003BA34E88
VKAERSAWLLAGSKALLSVTYAYQHALEQAQFEEAAPVPKPDGSQDGDKLQEPEVAVTVPTKPVGYIPAGTSKTTLDPRAG